jgi:hypothetical protein
VSQRRVITGAAGKATMVPVPAVPDEPAWAATLAHWVCTLPGQSAAWDNYVCTVVHLRDISGVHPATKLFPDAEYELRVYALDPRGRGSKPLDVSDYTTFIALLPHNLVLQFAVPMDEDARRLCDTAVEAMVAGTLPAEPMFSTGPGTRHQQLWEEFAEAHGAKIA